MNWIQQTIDVFPVKKDIIQMEQQRNVNHVHQVIMQIQQERHPVQFVQQEVDQRNQVDQHNVLIVKLEQSQHQMDCQHAQNVESDFIQMKRERNVFHVVEIVQRVATQMEHVRSVMKDMD